MNRFRAFARKVSRNSTRTCWVLKCDIRRFFASVDHAILTRVLTEHIPDPNTLWLLREVVGSFSASPGVGLPLGNLTSQLLVNVYMDGFDQFARHTLKSRHYIRYSDDFVLLSEDRGWLERQIPAIRDFLHGRLRLTLHPDKLFLKTLASGVDFLGWVHFPDHRVLRTSTKRRMIKRVSGNPAPETIASYSGLLQHGNANKIKSRYLKKALKSHLKKGSHKSL